MEGEFTLSHEVGNSEWKEECGVFGIWAPERSISDLCYLGLFSLQHRGQESAGIIVTDGMHLDSKKGSGLVTEIFRDRLPSLKAHCGIGHVRYSTIGSDSHTNIQPIFAYNSDGIISLAHNGSLTNGQSIRKELETKGYSFQTTTDSESILNLIAASTETTIEKKILKSLEEIEGAYCLTIMTGEQLIGVRDPHGFRPLCLGKLQNPDGYVLASETCALDAVEAEFIRDIEPGEMVVIDSLGMRSYFVEKKRKPSFCIFEYIYFARPDSVIDGQNVWQSRFRMGEELAREYQINADIVVPVPDTGIAAAIGFSSFSQIPYVEGLIKNRYIGRTFILPDQASRDQGVKMKLSPITANLKGKKVILVDDSIVRGTTSRRLISLLREAGAKEVHMCICSPAITDPCYYGIDTSIRKELIGATLSSDEIRDYIGADGLHYLSLQGLLRAVKDPNQEKMCSSCFDGTYPTNVEEISKCKE